MGARAGGSGDRKAISGTADGGIIADMFIPTGDIGGRGRGQGRVGEGERPMGHARGGKKMHGGGRQRGMEQGERE